MRVSTDASPPTALGRNLDESLERATDGAGTDAAGTAAAGTDGAGTSAVSMLGTPCVAAPRCAAAASWIPGLVRVPRKDGRISYALVRTVGRTVGSAAPVDVRAGRRSMAQHQSPTPIPNSQYGPHQSPAAFQTKQSKSAKKAVRYALAVHWALNCL